MRRVLSGPILVTAILCVAMVVFSGCSPGNRYKVLAFFFDGVPAPGGAGGPGSAGQTASGQRIHYVHKPYAEGKCGSCHAGDQMEMTIDRPMNIKPISAEVCVSCHSTITTAYPVMHGPVASAQCLFCHAPHESPVRYLLKMQSPRVCVQCHTSETMVPHRPEHQDEKADCLTCHVGHGGPSHGLLQPAPPPATRPATTSPAAPKLPDGRAAL